MPDFVVPNPKPNKPLCHACWHLKHAALYLAVYDLIGHLTSGGKTEFFASLKYVSKYFNSDYEYTRRVFAGLRAKGWIAPAKEPGHFLWIHHDDWAAANPGRCFTRELLPWQETADPLVGKLWALSNRKLRCFENMVKQAKALASDEEILSLYRQALAEVPARKKAGIFVDNSAKGCFWRIIKDMKARRAAA
jgi:hypothetical protein